MSEGKGFPHRKEDFHSDSRISFYEEEGKYILEDEDGEEWDWVEETGKWVPAVCPSIIAP
jgi:hypothetical protein